MSTANFLPWRQQRRMRCLRFWGVLFIASLLVTLTLGLGLRMNHDVKLRGLQSELAGINAVQQILKTRQRPSAPLATTEVESRPVAWQPALESLSAVMPAQAWLSALRYQPPVLTVSGYASALPALAAMTDALKQVAGFSFGSAGELQQDSQGRWVFTFQLKRRG